MSQDTTSAGADKFFTTADYYVAAFLIARRGPYRGSFLGEEKKVQFRFLDSPELQDLLLDFASGAEVPARDFAEAHRFISGQSRKARNGGVR
jgi:hypothetical protein